MSLHLSPEVVVAAYEFLRACAPYRRWNLPPADEIEFRVVRNNNIYGAYDEGETHVITISERKVGHTVTLIATMAHEMIHLHLALSGKDDAGEHGAEFKKIAARVCKMHGFDPKAF